jgi:hypothetical protein
VAITDSAGRILMANRAFAVLVGQRSEEALRGLDLPELLGDGDGLWRALVARTRAQGIVPRAPITVRLGSRAAVAVETTATLLTEGEQECLGFTLRPTDALAVPAIDPVQLIGQGLAELAEQLGRVPLAALLAEIHTLAEKQLIANALLRAGGGVPLAAQMLGISPRALERRLRRHRIDLPGDGSGAPPRMN